MSALPSNLKLTKADAPSQAIDLARFISVREAARVLSCNRDHLARRCRDELSAKSIAIHGVGPKGGNSGWFISAVRPAPATGSSR